MQHHPEETSCIMGENWCFGHVELGLASSLEAYFGICALRCCWDLQVLELWDF